jgi:hypothetical protein
VESRESKRPYVDMRIHVLLILIIICGRQDLVACSCIGEASVKQAVKTSDAVVIGTILSGEPYHEVDSTWIFGKDSLGNERYFSFTKMKYVILVTDKFKGKFEGDTIIVRTGMGGGDCGYEFEVGNSYIIYSYKDPERSKEHAAFVTNICTRTCPATDMTEIALIKKATRKKWALAH